LIIARASFAVTGAAFDKIMLTVEQPTLLDENDIDDGEAIYGCDYSIVGGSYSESATIYGAGSLHSLLLTLSHVADKIAWLASETGAVISPGVWQELERVRIPQEVVEAMVRSDS
jgi:hypothetical protein